MNRRNKGKSKVKGPNSALTEFLRAEGITDAYRERREREERERETIAEVADQSSNDVEVIEEESSPATVSDNGSSTGARRLMDWAVQDQTEAAGGVEQEVREAARAKRRAARGRDDFPSDSDDSDADYIGDSDDAEDGRRKTRNFGEKDSCVDCGDQFTLNVYSRFLRDKRGYLCENCHELLKVRERELRKNQLNARKKRKKLARALLDKTHVKLPTLQDICITKITQNIGDVDALGDIGQVNMNKISKILSRNRSLNSSTMSLFLTPNLKSLEFWDCSNVDYDSFSKIASFCPNIESLTLYMCGQFHNDNLKYYASNLKHLRELNLNGPFLINDQVWQEYFEECHTKLTKFEVRNTHRFENDSLISLLVNCGSSLKSLKLSHLDGLNSASMYELIPHYLNPGLEELELSFPHDEELISDDLLINILTVCGSSLTSLNVDGCTNLTDIFLKEGLCKLCPNLSNLSMAYIDQVTNDGFADAFDEYNLINPGGLINVCLTKCTGLADRAVYSLLKHSGSTLVELNLNGIYLVSKNFLCDILKNGASRENTGDAEQDIEAFSRKELPNLTSLDIGFVRAVDDEVLSLMNDRIPKLKFLEVFGNNRCSSRVQPRRDLLIIGRQSDTI